MKAYIAIPIVLVFACQFAIAEDINWINPAGGNWNDPTNWDLARLPTDQDSVTISASTPLVIDVSEAPMYLELNIYSGDVTLALGDQIPWISTVNCEPNTVPMRIVNIAGDQQSSALTVTNGIFFNADESCDNGANSCIYINVGFGTGSTGNLHLIDVEDGLPFGDGFVTIGHGEKSVGHIEFDTDSNTLCYSDVRSNYQSSVLIRANRRVICDRMYVDSLIVENDVFFAPWEWLQAEELIVKENSHVATDDIASNHIVLSKSTVIGGGYFYGPTIDILESPVFIYFELWLDNAHLNINIDDSTEPIITGGSINTNYNIVTDIYSASKTTPSAPSLITLMTHSGSPDQFRLILGSPPQDGLTYTIASDRRNSTLRIAPPNWNPADLNFDGKLNFFDISAFIGLYLDGSPWANVTEDDGLNFFDVSAFLAHFATP
jgi:hypothetical protein